MHRQKACGLIHGKLAICPSIHMKVGYTCVFFVKEENVAEKSPAGTGQLL
jgi:hypothetical protein